MDVEQYMRALGVEIAAQMSLKGITQKALVEATGISESTLRRYIKGTRDVPSSALLVIASALSIPAHELVERAEIRHARESVTVTPDFFALAAYAPGERARDREDDEDATGL